MHHFNVCKILCRLRLHQSTGAYLSSCRSFTGSHIFPVCDCPLSTGLLAFFPSLFSIFSIFHPSIQQALIKYLVYILFVVVCPGPGQLGALRPLSAHLRICSCAVQLGGELLG